MLARLRPFIGSKQRNYIAPGVVIVLVAALLPGLTSSAGAAGTPASVIFSTQPGNGAPDTALSPQPVVTTRDADGHTLSTSDVISVTLTGPDGAALSSLAALTCPNATASSGVATFTGCKVDRGGIFTLTAHDGSLTVVSDEFFVSGPAQLIFSTQPSGGTAGTTWATQPEVTVADAHGDPVATSTAHVVLGIRAGTGAAGAVLNCSANDVAATAGVAHYSGCDIDRSAANYRLVAIDAVDQLISAPTNAFNITAGAVDHLTFSAQPSGGAGGAAFTQQPVVSIQDSQGNTAIGNDDGVTVAIKSGTGTAGAQLTCPSATAADGIAAFTGCTIDKAGTGYVLIATDSAASKTVESAPFSVSTGGATGVSFTTQPGGGPGGAAFAQQPVVKIADAGGNAVPGSVTLTIVAGTGTAGAVLSCAANPSAAPNGIATFAGCTISLTGTGYRLRATSGSLTTTSALFDVSAGVPATLAFSTQPGNGTGGSALSTQPVVHVTDAGGNAAAGPVTLAIVSGTGTPGAALSCASNPVSSVGGTATFAGCSVDMIGVGYRLVATSGAARQLSAAFDVTVGPAAQLAFATQPGGGTGGAPWSVQPVVHVQDAGGNQVPGSSASITLSVAPGTGPGVLTCTANDLPATRGAAQFTGCRIDRTASAYRLTAVDSAANLSATSHTFAVTTGAAADLVFTGQPGGSTAGATFPAQPAVTVVDRGGNPVGGSADVDLAVTPGTGSGGTLSCAATTLAAEPTASFTGCAIDNAGGGYTLRASADDLRVESAPFAVLLPPPGPLGQAPTNVPVAQTFGARIYANNPTNVADGVNTATGQLTFGRSDLTVAGIGVPFELVRTYNSGDPAGGSFGRGWTSLFDLNVTFSANKTLATVRGEDGQQIVFTANPAGGWLAPPGARSSLTCAAKLCTVTRFDGYRFEVSNGRVSSYLAPTGMGLQFAWSATRVVVTVRTTAKTPLVVTANLDSAGRVSNVASPTRSVSYSYAAGLLSSVTDVRQKTWTYGYASSRLTTETDPLGHVRLTAGYDANGRVSATTRQGSSRHVDDTFAWGANTGTRKVLTSVNGTVQRENYVDEYVGNVLVKQTNPLGAAMRYSYDSRVNLVEVQDPTGWVQEMSYDAANNMIRVSSPISSTSAAVVSMTYDNSHRLLLHKDANGNPTTHVYNGPALAFVRPAGVTPGTGYSYDATFNLAKIQTASGQQVFTRDPAGNVKTIQTQTLKGVSLNGKGTLATYDEAGNRLTSVDPRGNLASVDPAFRTTWVYDKAGHLLSSTTPGPITSAFTYDNAGDLKTTTNAAGTTTHDWDEATRTLTMTGPGSRTVIETFDPSGNLLTESSSAGDRTITHTYDAAGREISTTDPAGVVTRYGYDLTGSVVAMSDSLGNTIARQFDSLNRPIREVSNGVETRAAWDPAGNIVSVTDAGGAVTRSTWNSHGLIASVKSAAGTTTYGYDLASDELRTVTDGNGHVTTYLYDAAARRISEARGGSTTKYAYDLAGNTNNITDPDGRTKAITFNAQNRPAKTVYSQTGKTSITVTEGYDAFGRRTDMTDSAGHHTYAYDAAGNLTSASVPGGTFTYDYSHPGKIIETYPDGTEVKYGVDDAQHLMSVESGTPGSADYVKASYVRDALRQTSAVAYSNGVFETRQYDRAGNLLDQQLRNAAGPLADDTFTYDAAGNRLTQQNTVGEVTTSNAYGYDATGQLTSFTTASGPGTLTGADVPATGAPGTPHPSDIVNGGGETAAAFGVTTSVDPAAGDETSFGYDAVGNRTSKNGPAGTLGASYDAADRVSGQSGAGAAEWTHDRDGNVTRIGSTSFGYDAAGRLTSATSGGSTITYQYDGDGLRIAKTTSGNTTRFTWDPFGALPQLVREETGSGELIRRYIYGDGPVAMQTSDGTFFFHLDPVGSVNELTDASGDIAAAYQYDAFGNVTTTGADAPDNPLLFQGQYRDADTGRYYMRARYYDAQSGRFLQRDPLPQAVGVPAESSYVFAANRPTVFTDPKGEATVMATSFEGKSTTEGNALNNTKMGLAGVSLGVKATSKFGGYTAAVSQAALSAKIGAELAPEAAAAAKVGGKLAKVGAGLAVVGVLLQVAVTVLDCLYGDAYTCAGSVIGTTISIGFTVGCTFITSGVGAAACAMAGVALSIGLQYIVTHFGPQIVEGLTTAALFLAGPFPGLVSDFAAQAGEAISGFAGEAGGAIVSGFNDATTAISSGFDTAMKTLVAAGYAAGQLAVVLADAFVQGFDDALAGLIGLGYDIADIAASALEVFNATAAEVGEFLKDGFNYGARQIADALSSAYDATAAEVGQILKDAGFAVNQVANALQQTYDLAAAQTAAILDDLGYGFNQIADALGSVYAQSDKFVADALADLGATAAQVAAALRDFYNDLDAAAADALKFAGYAVDQIAGALQTAYDATAQGVATILKDLSYGATVIASALKDVFDTLNVQAAQILKTVGFALLEVAGALKDAFLDAAATAAAALRTIGYTVVQIGTALKDTFTQTAALAAGILRDIGYDVIAVGAALKDAFSQAASVVAQTLKDIGYAATAVANALKEAFVLGAQAVADFLLDIFDANAVASALSNAFLQTAAEVAAIFKTLGQTAAQIAGVLSSVFNQAADAVATILKNIGETAAEIAGVLQNVFGQAASAVANLLSSIGFNNDTINAIGGAFESFGKAVEDCFSSFFTDC